MAGLTNSLADKLQQGWLEPNALTYLLLPLTVLYRMAMRLRHLLYKLNVFHVYKSPVPVLIVGNISVGGTGKTPLTMEIVEQAKKLGFKPGVISRGYGGQNLEWPQLVKTDSSPYYFGDEPVLIANSTQCPVAVGPKRGENIELLLKNHDCDLIIADDGLQHYALDRDIEIAVYDNQRRHLNNFCLPSGPLREPVNRLKTVDLVMKHVAPDEEDFENSDQLMFKLAVSEFSSLVPDSKKSLDSKKAPEIHAVAGIGHPKRFFKQLTALGFNVIEHPFSDHHKYEASDFSSMSDYPVVMTEKDAIKCTAFAQEHWFSLAVTAELNAEAKNMITKKLSALKVK